MAHIEFIDQTLRDGQQSLWGMRMRAYQATPTCRTSTATGFRVVDLTGGTLFVVMLRESGDDPWAALDHSSPASPTTGHRAGMRPVAVGSFGFVPDSMLDLWVGTLVKHGIQTHWLFDCLYDMPLMKAKAEGDPGGRRRGRAGDHVRADRPPHRRVLRRPRPRNGELGRRQARSTSRTRRAC